MQVTGELQDHLTCWDALSAALPVGTVSGAPKVCGYFACFHSFHLPCGCIFGYKSMTKCCQNKSNTRIQLVSKKISLLEKITNCD